MEYKLTFKQYNEALKQSKLLGLKCKECGTITVPPKIACRICGSTNLEVVQLGNKGKIQTFTVVNVGAEGRESEVPYILALVELGDGPWILGNIIGIEPAKANMDLIGKKVTMGVKVFAGDKFSSGDAPRPVFTLES